MLKFCYATNYSRNVNSGPNLEIKLGLVFFIKPPLKSSLNNNKKKSSSFKKKEICLLKWTHKPWTIIFLFFGKLCNLRQWCHNCAPTTWIYTLKHMSNWKIQQYMFRICCVCVSCNFLNQLGMLLKLYCIWGTGFFPMAGTVIRSQT